MMNFSEIQEVYESLQTARIRLRCSSACVMNVEQMELLSKVIHITEAYILRYRSAAYAYGIHLQELSVWKTFAAYAHCPYRFYSSHRVNNMILDTMDSIKNIISAKNDAIRFSRIKIMLENYLIQISKCRKLMQAFQ